MIIKDTERWRRLRAIYDEAAELAVSERDAVLKARCAGDAAMRADVERLLALAEKSDLALDRSPVLSGSVSSFLPQRLEPGQVLAGRFTVVRQLGEGGVGEVYEARDSVLGQPVALKTLHALFAQDEAVLERFKREILLARRISHPNVCRTFDFYQAEVSFLTMELLAGETLADRIRRDGALPSSEAVRILTQAVEGLAAAHSQGVLHRDLKPSNIFLCPDRVVLLDFGLARLQQQDPDDPPTSPSSALGTPAYMSPEQIENRPLTAASDVYSLGVVFYAMLTGGPPHAGLSPLAIAARRVQEAPPSPKALNPGVPARLDRLTRECLAIAAEDRPRDAAALLERLRSPSGWRLSRRSVRLLAFSVAAILLVASAIAVIARRGESDPMGRRFYREGLAAWRDGSPARAARLFEQAGESSALALARQAQSLLEIDAPDRAKDTMLRAAGVMRRAWFPSARERLEFEALNHWVERNFPSSATVFSQLADAVSSDERGGALIDVALARVKAEQFVEARRAIEASLAADPRSPAAALHLGILRGREGDMKGARASFDKAESGFQALSQIEGVVRTDFERGVLYRQTGQLAEASAAFQSAAGKAKTSALDLPRIQSEFGLVMVDVDAGDRTEAESKLEQVVQFARARRLDAAAASALNDLGFAHLTQYRLKEAEHAVNQALQFAREQRARQTEARSHLLLASIFYHAGRAREGAAHIAPAVEFFGRGGYRRNLTQARLLSARIETASGRYAEADKQWRALLASLDAASHDGAVAAEGLATALAFQGRLPESLALYRQAEQAYRKSGRATSLAYCLMNQGELLWQLGDAAAARVRFDQAVEQSKRDPRMSARAAMARAWMLTAEGDAAAVRAQLETHRAMSKDESPYVRAEIAALQAWVAFRSGDRAAGSRCDSILAALPPNAGNPERLQILLHCAPISSARRAGYLRQADTLAAEASNREAAYRVALLQPNRPESAVRLLRLIEQWGAAAVNKYSQRPDIRALIQ